MERRSIKGGVGGMGRKRVNRVVGEERKEEEGGGEKHEKKREKTRKRKGDA